eukprot:scaffold477_cov355-Pinguiococcus_pyrenoidosus.AAC.14
MASLGGVLLPCASSLTLSPNVARASFSGVISIRAEYMSSDSGEVSKTLKKPSEPSGVRNELRSLCRSWRGVVKDSSAASVWLPSESRVALLNSQFCRRSSVPVGPGSVPMSSPRAGTAVPFPLRLYLPDPARFWLCRFRFDNPRDAFLFLLPPERSRARFLSLLLAGFFSWFPFLSVLPLSSPAFSSHSIGLRVFPEVLGVLSLEMVLQSIRCLRSSSRCARLSCACVGLQSASTFSSSICAALSRWGVPVAAAFAALPMPAAGTSMLASKGHEARVMCFRRVGITFPMPPQISKLGQTLRWPGRPVLACAVSGGPRTRLPLPSELPGQG